MSITYVMQMDGPDALVKFGRTRNVKARYATLRTGLPWPLHIVALFGIDVEAELKRQFAADRVQGEWYRPSAALASYLMQAADDGRLVKQVAVDQAYINAAIKPRIREYLNGREPTNNVAGDLVRCIFADLLPTLSGREKELIAATKGHVTEAMTRGYGPTTDRPHLIIPDATAITTQAAA